MGFVAWDLVERRGSDEFLRFFVGCVGVGAFLVVEREMRVGREEQGGIFCGVLPGEGSIVGGA